MESLQKTERTDESSGSILGGSPRRLSPHLEHMVEVAPLRHLLDKHHVRALNGGHTAGGGGDVGLGGTKPDQAGSWHV